MKMSILHLQWKHMKKSQKHNIKRKTPNTERNIVYDSIYINFNHKQNIFTV